MARMREAIEQNRYPVFLANFLASAEGRASAREAE